MWHIDFYRKSEKNTANLLSKCYSKSVIASVKPTNFLAELKHAS